VAQEHRPASAHRRRQVVLRQRAAGRSAATRTTARPRVRDRREGGDSGFLSRSRRRDDHAAALAAQVSVRLADEAKRWVRCARCPGLAATGALVAGRTRAVFARSCEVGRCAQTGGRQSTETAARCVERLLIKSMRIRRTVTSQRSASSPLLRPLESFAGQRFSRWFRLRVLLTGRSCRGPISGRRPVALG